MRQLLVEIKTAVTYNWCWVELFIFTEAPSCLAARRNVCGWQQLGAPLSQVTEVLMSRQLGCIEWYWTVDKNIAVKRKVNTVLVVEHDKDVMMAADEIIDIGRALEFWRQSRCARNAGINLEMTRISRPDNIWAAKINGTLNSCRAKNIVLFIKGAKALIKNTDVETPLASLFATGVSGSENQRWLLKFCPAIASVSAAQRKRRRAFCNYWSDKLMCDFNWSIADWS